MFRKNKGFTLVEVMVAMALLVGTWVVILEALVAYKYMAVYPKHKVQAIYTAQRILEEQRRLPFANLVSKNYGTVSIDTRGTFNDATDDFTGTATITVTNLDAYRKRVQVQINWTERRLFGAAANETEFCTTDIANESQLN